MSLLPSDRKKLLALPFYMKKRAELPEPRLGQPEYQLFKEIYGKDWYDDIDVEHDLEHKITEFNYEKFINPQILRHIDTKDPQFLE